MDSLSTVARARFPLRAIVRDSADAILTNQPVSWRSSDTTLASVDSTGFVSTTLSTGFVRIVATSGPRSDTLLLRIGVISFTSVSVGDYHVCGITQAHNAYCWGLGSSGELGIGDTIHVGAPARVLSDLSFAEVVAGYRHTCARTTDNKVYCWGANDIGQLGIGARDNAAHLTPGVSAGTFTGIRTGDFHTCGFAPAGGVFCWGFGHYGQIGNGAITDVNATPVALNSAASFRDVSGGQVHTCAIAADSTAYCWGNPGPWLGWETCGGGLCYASPQPGLMTVLNFTAISAGEVHTCGVADYGYVWCWGINSNGQLGDTVRGSSLGHAVVNPTYFFAQVVVGTYHTCAVQADGSTYCWGANGGAQLGNGTLQDSASPVPIAGDFKFAAISAATNYSCGITTVSVVYCWGTDYYGYGVLGTGDAHQVTMHAVPTRVLGQP